MTGKIFRVGGAVRDKLLKLPVTETDWVVVGSTPQAMLDAGFKQVGKDFPVFLHPDTNEEYALARTERKRGKGYHGFAIDAHPDVTLEEDLIRRDLTVNAMAMAENGEIIDPYGGQRDLERRLLRHVSPAFAEDPLRVLRTARFAARYHHLGFRIATQTMDLMRQLSASGELATLAKERIWQETQKGLSERSPQILLSTLLECGALQALFPEWAESLDSSVLDALARSHEHGLAIESRFALSTSKLDAPALKTLCSSLAAPKPHSHLAQVYQRVTPLAPDTASSSAEATLSTLEHCDILRRPGLIEQVCAIEHTVTGKHYDHYLRAAAALQSVSSQRLIEQGFSGKALGQALRAERLKHIQEQL